MYWSHGQGILPIDAQTQEVVSDTSALDEIHVGKDGGSFDDQERY